MESTESQPVVLTDEERQHGNAVLALFFFLLFLCLLFHFIGFRQGWRAAEARRQKPLPGANRYGELDDP